VTENDERAGRGLIRLVSGGIAPDENGIALLTKAVKSGSIN
jgi:hypothetical protein